MTSPDRITITTAIKAPTIAEVFAVLEACWVPPTLAQARAGMQITVW